MKGILVWGVVIAIFLSFSGSMNAAGNDIILNVQPAMQYVDVGNGSSGVVSFSGTVELVSEVQVIPVTVSIETGTLYGVSACSPSTIILSTAQSSYIFQITAKYDENMTKNAYESTIWVSATYEDGVVTKEATTMVKVIFNHIETQSIPEDTASDVEADGNETTEPAGLDLDTSTGLILAVVVAGAVGVIVVDVKRKR